MFKYGWNKTGVKYGVWKNTEVFLENKKKLLELAFAYKREYLFWKIRKTQNLDKKMLKRVLANEKGANKLWRLFFRAYKKNDFKESL